VRTLRAVAAAAMLAASPARAGALPVPAAAVQVSRCGVAWPASAPGTMPWAPADNVNLTEAQVLGMRLGRTVLYSDYGNATPVVPPGEPLGARPALLLGRGGAPLTGTFDVEVRPFVLAAPSPDAVTAVGGAEVSLTWPSVPGSVGYADDPAHWAASLAGESLSVSIPEQSRFVAGVGGGIVITLPPNVRGGTITLRYCGSSAPVRLTVPPPIISGASAKIVASFGGPQTTTEGQPITVTGAGFPLAPGAGVGLYLDGQPMTDVAGWRGGILGGSITVVVPPDFPAGTWPVTIRDGAGTSNAVPLTVDPQGGRAAQGAAAPPAGPVAAQAVGEVVAPRVRALRVVGAAPLAVGGSEALQAVGGSGGVAWVSGDPRVATVSPAGIVTAHAPGAATIEAVRGGQVARAVVRVAGPVPATSRAGGRLAAAIAGAVALALLLAAALLRRRRRPTGAGPAN
jgi:hypothetical protein